MILVTAANGNQGKLLVRGQLRPEQDRRLSRVLGARPSSVIRCRPRVRTWLRLTPPCPSPLGAQSPAST